MHKDMWRKNNMENILWKRGIVFGIMVLFVGSSVVPSISGNNSKIYVEKERIDVEE